MTSADPLDKDRLFFTQNNSPIRVKCPECLRVIKNPRQTPIFKKLPALWWHFKRDHGEVSNLFFTTKDVKDALNGLSKALDLGILPPEAKPEVVRWGSVDTATSSSLEFDGRPSRIDVFERLIEIGRLFKGQTQFYPNLTLKQIERWSLVILKNVDARTQKKYVDCVTKYSKKDIVKGEYDVTGFCDTVGV